MTNNQNQPNQYDAVLGGNAPPPIHGAVLGGIGGVKRRLASSNVDAQVAALNDALNYRDVGLNFLIETLQHESVEIQRYVYKLLQDKEETHVKQALQNYKFWTSFEKYYKFPTNHATTFANRKVIEFDPKIGITNTLNTAYAIRGYTHWGYKKYDITIADKLKLLLQNPLANKVEALVFGHWFERDSKDLSSRNVVNALLDVHEKLQNIKAIFIGDIPECSVNSIVQSELSYIFLAYPKLEVLKIRGDSNSLFHLGEPYGLEFSKCRHENLKTLIVEANGLRYQVVNQICQLELPALEYLELWLGSKQCYRDEMEYINDLMPIFSGKFPKLKYLGLHNTDTDEIAFAIVNSQIIKNLVELDMSVGTMTDMGAEALLNCPAIRQLDTLDISYNGINCEMIEKFKQLDINLIFKSNMPPDYNRFYPANE